MTHPIHNHPAPTDEDKLWSGLAYAGLACALLPTVIIFWLKRDESYFIRFNCLQALGLGAIALIGLLALGILGPFRLVSFMVGLGFLLGSLVFIGIWIYAMIRTFTGQEARIPILGELIDRYLIG